MTPTESDGTPSTASPAPSTAVDMHEARAGDRGSASGRNIAQNRAIGQDDPMEGSRLGRERDKASGFPGAETPSADVGTDAAQTAEAENGASAQPPPRTR